MGWTLVEQCWTLYFTSGGVSLEPFCPPKMALWGPRTPQKWPEIAILGHRQSQQPQRHWKWQCQWQCHLKFTLKDPWIPWYPWNNHFCSFTKIFPFMIVTILGQKKGRFWALLGPKKAVSGQLWGLIETFPGVLNGHNWPPWMWNKMFNQSSIHSGLLGMPMAKYGNFGSKMAVFEHFLGPKKTFLGVFNGYNRPP